MTNSPEFPDNSVVTTDLVMRLRSENNMPPYYGVPKLQVEAAEEIERLRAALEELIWYTNQLELDVYDPSEWSDDNSAVKNARAGR